MDILNLLWDLFDAHKSGQLHVFLILAAAVFLGLLLYEFGLKKTFRKHILTPLQRLNEGLHGELDVWIKMVGVLLLLLVLVIGSGAIVATQKRIPPEERRKAQIREALSRHGVQHADARFVDLVSTVFLDEIMSRKIFPDMSADPTQKFFRDKALKETLEKKLAQGGKWKESRELLLSAGYETILQLIEDD